MNRETKAFTLIELLVVISIIALLSSVVLASLNAARGKARLAAAKRGAMSMDSALGAQAIGWWDFDECSGPSAADKSGEGADGTLGGGATWTTGTPTGAGCALSLNGSEQYAQVTPGVAAPGSFTIASWFKTGNGQQNAWRTIASKQNGSNNRNYWFGLSGSASAPHCGFGTLTLLWSVAGSVDAGRVCSPARFDDNQWHHGAAVYDGTTLRLYVDGVQVGANAASGPDQQDYPTVIGLYSDMGTNDWNGQIDSLRIYATSLTAAEIGRLYAAGSERHEFAHE